MPRAGQGAAGSAGPAKAPRKTAANPRRRRALGTGIDSNYDDEDDNDEDDNNNTQMHGASDSSVEDSQATQVTAGSSRPKKVAPAATGRKSALAAAAEMPALAANASAPAVQPGMLSTTQLQELRRRVNNVPTVEGLSPSIKQLLYCAARAMLDPVWADAEAAAGRPVDAWHPEDPLPAWARPTVVSVLLLCFFCSVPRASAYFASGR